MASAVSQYSTTGFYRAPVSKGLMGVLFITCTAINVPFLSHLRQYLVCRLPDAVLGGEVWRLLSARAAFLETKDLICGALLVYSFRVFERRFGSRKFASHLLATTLMSLVLETALVTLIKSSQWGLHHSGYLPPGPYGLIFPLFVPYLFNIPRITRTHVLGIPITGKTLTYLVGLQMCSTSIPIAITSLCSIVSDVDRARGREESLISCLCFTECRILVQMELCQSSAVVGDSFVRGEGLWANSREVTGLHATSRGTNGCHIGYPASRAHGTDRTADPVAEIT